MKFSFQRNALFGIALSLVCSMQVAQAQLTGFGGTPATGVGGTAGIGGATTGIGGAPAATGAAVSNKLPGSFGGPGVTGQSRLELTTLNPSAAFSNGANASGATTAGQTTNGSAFGTSAFSNGAAAGATGATGGLGGSAIGGLGGRTGGLGGLGGLGGFGGLSGGGAGNSSAQSKKMIRPIVKPDIDIIRESPETIATNAQLRLARIPLPKKFRSVVSSVEGATIVLRGQVATASEKRLVERLVKLEPGIDLVRNEVTVRTSSPERIEAQPIR